MINCNNNRYETVVNKISKNRKIISYFCKKLEVDPVIFSCTIFAELNNNYNFYDRFDYFRAEIGSDPSIGFCQLKVSTIKWIENNYRVDKLGINKSKSIEELIKKMKNDTINIIYGIIYVKLIIKKYKDTYGRSPKISAIASYYSLGIDYGKEIYSKNYLNKMGITADSIYAKNIFQNIFVYQNIHYNNNKKPSVTEKIRDPIL